MAPPPQINTGSEVKRGHGPEGVQIVKEKALGTDAPIALFVGGVVISATIVRDHELKTGHISRETDWGCTHGTESNPEYAETVSNMCKVWENRRCYRSTRLLFTMPCKPVLRYFVKQQERWKHQNSRL